MEKLKFNPNNKKYYSEEFIKGFECGVERQFNADMTEETAEWVITGTKMYRYKKCSNCECAVELGDMWKHCPNCGRRMKGTK